MREIKGEIHKETIICVNSKTDNSLYVSSQWSVDCRCLMLNLINVWIMMLQKVEKRDGKRVNFLQRSDTMRKIIEWLTWKSFLLINSEWGQHLHAQQVWDSIYCQMFTAWARKLPDFYWLNIQNTKMNYWSSCSQVRCFIAL